MGDVATERFPVYLVVCFVSEPIAVQTRQCGSVSASYTLKTNPEPLAR